MSPPCLLDAWSAHEAELRGYLRHRLGDAQDADELLQDVFLKALRQGGRFCAVENARAWLFQVTRNALADRLRSSRDQIPLPEDLPAPAAETMPQVDGLSQCLPRVLAELSETDRLALTLCDLEGQPQQVLADRLGLSLPGAKSRLQRARVRLRQCLVEACQVRFDDTGKVCCFTPRPPLLRSRWTPAASFRGRPRLLAQGRAASLPPPPQTGAEA
jgi:RNA polymerase sigma-70 factor (ECF subfamily)